MKFSKNPLQGKKEPFIRLPKPRFLMLLLVVGLLLQGCSNWTTRQAAKFSQQAANTGDAAVKFDALANAAKSEALKSQFLADPEYDPSTYNQLIATFDVELLRARAANAALTDYANALRAIASASTSKQAQDAASHAITATNNLKGAVSQIEPSLANQMKFDSENTEKIVGSIFDAALIHYKSKAIKGIVIQSDHSVGILCDALRIQIAALGRSASGQFNTARINYGRIGAIRLASTGSFGDKASEAYSELAFTSYRNSLDALASGQALSSVYPRIKSTHQRLTEVYEGEHLTDEELELDRQAAVGDLLLLSKQIREATKAIADAQVTY